MKALISGTAGFIGSHLCEKLLANGWEVTGVDNFNDSYDPQVKRRNIANSLRTQNFRLIEGDIRDSDLMDTAFDGDTDVVVHLAAMAGVRPSIAQPLLYSDVNV
jgi:UDP-glucuronate 4-epimerase